MRKADCNDTELSELLTMLAHSSFGDCYSTMIIDTPPFMGANPVELLNVCDEFVVVMRAEPLAYRTLPAFLELVQHSKKPDRQVQMLGILLTLPEGEPLGGRWECELRGRFGPRILPQVVPFDEEVGKALLLGQILRLYNPESIAAQQYLALTETLSLTSAAMESVILSSQAPLAALTASYQASGVMARVNAEAVASAGARAVVAALRLGRECDDELGCLPIEGQSARDTNRHDEPAHARDTVHDDLPGMAEEPDLPLANELPDLELTVPREFAPQPAAAPDSVPDLDSVFNPPPPPRPAPPRRPSAGPRSAAPDRAPPDRQTGRRRRLHSLGRP